MAKMRAGTAITNPFTDVNEIVTLRGAARWAGRASDQSDAAPSSSFSSAS